MYKAINSTSKNTVPVYNYDCMHWVILSVDVDQFCVRNLPEQIIL